MSSPEGIASAFSISGLLDEASKTRERFPIREVDVSAIEAHPANVAYSMDEASIKALASSIKKNGLTDIPLLRKLEDGRWQMISGHRRLAAYRMLSQDDGAFAKIPCRVIEGITDSQALVLLHTANYFVRALTVTERAKATEALGLEVERLRETDTRFSGMRSEDVKAAIVEDQTGKSVNGRTIRREEKLARVIKSDLSTHWAAEADAGRLSTTTVNILKDLPKEKQSRLFAERPPGLSKKETTEYLKLKLSIERPVDKRLQRALDEIKSYASTTDGKASEADRETIAELKRLTARLAKMCG